MGNIAIYPNAQGSATVYVFGGRLGFCSYDDSGNLFVASMDGAGFEELPANGSDLFWITVNGSNPGGAIQWDGRYLALGSPSENKSGPATVYRVKVSGSTGTIVNTIKLSTKSHRNARAVQFWLNGSRIITPEGSRHGRVLGLWGYPAGGEPKKTIKGAPTSAFGVTVSVAPR
jgi:hypothetical protein